MGRLSATLVVAAAILMTAGNSFAGLAVSRAKHRAWGEFRQVGIASWYGPGFHGKPTASGATFSQYELTAAHRKLPLGTHARVTNLTNGRSVVVEINDRGPYIDGRVIDLSRAAAAELGIIDDGLAKVRIDVLPQQLAMAQ